jgi:hypothetical protein
MIIQAPRQTILRCDAVRCGDVEELSPCTEIEARLWGVRNGWKWISAATHFCDRCSVPVKVAA